MSTSMINKKITGPFDFVDIRQDKTHICGYLCLKEV